MLSRDERRILDEHRDFKRLCSDLRLAYLSRMAVHEVCNKMLVEDENFDTLEVSSKSNLLFSGQNHRLQSFQI